MSQVNSWRPSPGPPGRARGTGIDAIVAQSTAANPRILCEELLHVVQVRSGSASTANVLANEIAARREMIERASERSITNSEVKEMLREIDLLRRQLEDR
jgi:hypothetical protein